MNFITTTDLRTKSSELIEILKKGTSVSLIHRSKVVGTIEPVEYTQAPPVTAEKIHAFIKAVKPKKLIPRSKREEIYRGRLLEKYGKSIS